MEVAHEASSVSCMQDPAKGFGQVISGIEDARNVAKDNVTGFFPVLDGKELDHDMTGPFRRMAGVDHINGGFVITVKWGWGGLREAKIGKNGTEIAGLFGGEDGGVKFGFCGAGGGEGLGFATVGNTCIGEEEGKTTGGAAAGEIVGMGGIKEACEMRARFKGREWGKGGIGGEEAERAGGKGRIGYVAEIMEPPGTGATQVFDNSFEHGEVIGTGSGGEFAECDDGVAYVGTACDIGVKEFAE